MAGYGKTLDGGATRFDTEPFGPPIPIMEAVYLGALCAFLIALIPAFGLIVSLVAGLLWTFTMYRSPKATKWRAPSSFKASAEGVEFGGVTFLARDIHRLVIRNHVSGLESSGPRFAFGAMDAASIHMRSKRLRKLAPVCYRLDLESGGKATTLAGGLDEPAAYGLMREAGAVLGFETN
jgi:hypothetical protein